MINTFCPACRWPTSVSPRSAVIPETGTAAACSKVRFDGLRASLLSRAAANSANEPLLTPNTSSPGWKRVTSLPIATTTPAASRPGTGFLGARRPTTKTRGVGHTGHQMPGAPVKAGGANLHQHLVGSDRRPLDLGRPQHICRAVLGLDDRSHPWTGHRTCWRLGRCCCWSCHLVPLSGLNDRVPHRQCRSDLTRRTTCVIASLVIVAKLLSSRSAAWLAPATVRWVLFVESCASLSWADAQPLISPTLALRTASGLP